MSTENEQLPEVIKYKDSVYNFVDGGIISGYTKRGTIPEKFPWIWWHGEKMPHRLWQQIIAFFEWSYNKGKDEALVYLYYNEETHQWMAWAPPQRGVGMRVNTVDDHPNWKQQEEFPGGFVRVGTGHHHCSAKAFQSGTDSNDEQTGNGLHFTVGCMDKQFHDLHARAVFNGNMVEVSLEDWVDMAEKYKVLNLPQELISRAYDYSLQSAAPVETEVPQMWKDNFLGWQSSTTGYQGNHHTSNGNGNPILLGYSGPAEQGGINGYYRIENGKQVFTPFANQHSPTNSNGNTSGVGGNGKYSYDSTRKTPNESGKEQLDELQRKGLKVTALQLICEDLRTTHQKDWTGGADHLAVINILKSNGLNVRWLEKYIEIEEAIQDVQIDNRYFDGMGV